MLEASIILSTQVTIGVLDLVDEVQAIKTNDKPRHSVIQRDRWFVLNKSFILLLKRLSYRGNMKTSEEQLSI